MAEIWMWQSQQDYDEWINELLENTPESYDDDAAAEAIIVAYVRNLEGLVGWLLDGEHILIDNDEDAILIEDRTLPNEARRLVLAYMERHLPEVELFDGLVRLDPIAKRVAS